MKIKEGGGKGSGKGKAIIGIAMAAIMLASVFAAMVPTAVTREANSGDIVSGDTLFLGEHGLHFDTAALPDIVNSLKKFDDGTVVATILIADPSDFTISTSRKTGGYKICNATICTHEINMGDITIEEPEITAKAFIEGTTDSVVGISIPVGTNITIRIKPNFGGLMRNAADGSWSKVKIKLDEPGGGDYEYSTLVNATDQEIDVGPTAGMMNDVVWAMLDTTNWDTGTWKVKIVSDKDTCNEVDVSSPEYEFTVRSEELSIEAEEDVVGKGEDIILTVIGYPIHYYYFAIENVVDNKEPEIKDTADIVSLGTGEGSPGAATAAWIKTGSDGIADIKIDTTGADERTYTMHVYDNPSPSADYPTPADIDDYDDHDDVDVEVTEAEVTFDMPTKVVIGEEVTIKGTVNAGDKVDILIDDEYDDNVRNSGDNIDVDENNEFEADWHTEGYMTGSYTIDVYIDYNGVKDVNPDVDEEDGSITIRLIEPGLTANQTRNVTAEGDDYTINGTATGMDDVDIVLIGPNGYPLADPGLGVLNGLEITSTSVDDNEFSEDVTMTEGLDLGMWITLVFSPGRDGEYGDLGVGAGELADIPTSWFAGKTQAQIVAILMDHTVDVAGSDDVHVDFTFEVETPYVTFDPIESVTIGEPLEITGKTNRELGTIIVIYTIDGPMYLPAVITEVEWPTAYQGIFNAKIDTTYAVAGNYTLRADDGDWNTDTATVEILPAISIFDTEAPANPYPSIFGTHNGTITTWNDIVVHKMYTYPCSGTGGHSEYVRIWGHEIEVNATWDGYIGDWHNITFDEPFITLEGGKTYNYTIRTGSYPQIIHARSKDVTGGVINCTEFIDANGKEYSDWIPAIRLE